MATLLEKYRPDLWNLNPKNPREREELIEGYKRIETQLARQQRLVENESHTQGHRHAENQVRRRDWLDAILSELHARLYGLDSDTDLEECRSKNCRATAPPLFEGSGYCATCLTHAQHGTQPEFDQTLPPKAIVGSPWGRD